MKIVAMDIRLYVATMTNIVNILTSIYRGENPVYKFMEKMLGEVEYCKAIINPKQAGGGGGIRPQAGSSLCCAETVSSRKLKLSDIYYILIGLNSEYKPV